MKYKTKYLSSSTSLVLSKHIHDVCVTLLQPVNFFKEVETQPPRVPINTLTKNKLIHHCWWVVKLMAISGGVFVQVLSGKIDANEAPEYTWFTQVWSGNSPSLSVKLVMMSVSNCHGCR